MPKGIALPLKSVNGRFAMKEGAEYTSQLVKLAVMDSDSANPFDAGEADSSLFETITGESDGAIAARVRREFQHLEEDELARVLRVHPRSSESDTTVHIEWEDMETGKRHETAAPTQANPQ